MIPKFYRKEGWENVMPVTVAFGEKAQLYMLQVSAKSGMLRVLPMKPVVPDFERPKKDKPAAPEEEVTNDATE